MSCTDVMTTTVDRSAPTAADASEAAASIPAGGRARGALRLRVVRRGPRPTRADVAATSSRSAGDWRDFVPMPGLGIVRL